MTYKILAVGPLKRMKVQDDFLVLDGEQLLKAAGGFF